MKTILGITASPRKLGNCELMIKEIGALWGKPAVAAAVAGMPPVRRGHIPVSRRQPGPVHAVQQCRRPAPDPGRSGL